VLYFAKTYSNIRNYITVRKHIYKVIWYKCREGFAINV